MVTVVNEDQGYGDIGKLFGGGVAKGYTNRSDEMALQKAIGALPPDATGKQVLDTIMKTRTYSPEAKETALKNYIGVEKFEQTKKTAESNRAFQKAKSDIELSKEKRTSEEKQAEPEKVAQIVNALNLPEEQKEGLSKSLNLQAATDLLKMQMQNQFKPHETSLEKKISNTVANNHVKLLEEMPKLRDTLTNVDHVESLFNELNSPLSGVVGTKLAKQIDAESFALLDAPIKIFNPSGPIAVRKMELLKDIYQVKSTDLPWTAKGKLEAIRRFAKQAISRGEEKLKKYEQWEKEGHLPTPQELSQLSEDDDSLIDVFLDYEKEKPDANVPSDMPDPAEYKGVTVTSPDGKVYRSDGMRWVEA